MLIESAIHDIIYVTMRGGTLHFVGAQTEFFLQKYFPAEKGTPLSFLTKQQDSIPSFNHLANIILRAISYFVPVKNPRIDR